MYTDYIKPKFLTAVQDEIQAILTNYSIIHELMIPFYLDSSKIDTFNYWLVEDRDEAVGFEKLNDLVDSFINNFQEEDHLCVFFGGKSGKDPKFKTVKDVKFSIGKGLISLNDALEYKDTVGINNKIYTKIYTDSRGFDTFRIKDGNIEFVVS